MKRPRRELCNIRDILMVAFVGCVASAFAEEPAKDTPLYNSADLPISTDVGERVLRFDFPALRIGIAEYPHGPTGTTVLHLANGGSMAMDVRGGSPGVLGDYGFVHAIVLSGGSLPGLEAVSGVSAELLEQSGEAARWNTIPLVSGGIVYDFGGRNNGIHPDKRLGRAAFAALGTGRFPLGARGAGIAVTVGNGFAFDRGEASGQGAAFRDLGGVKIFACTVLNAVGAIFDRKGALVRGHLDPETGARSTFAEDLERRVGQANAASSTTGAAPGTAPGRNTTLTVVVTNLRLQRHDLMQVGRQVHSSMARAIRPFHTRDDGDTLWMVSTQEVELPQWSPTALGVAASEVVWDAVLTAHP